jgi:hypothetical protein
MLKSSELQIAALEALAENIAAGRSCLAAAGLHSRCARHRRRRPISRLRFIADAGRSRERAIVVPVFGQWKSRDPYRANRS